MIQATQLFELFQEIHPLEFGNLPYAFFKFGLGIRNEAGQTGNSGCLLCWPKKVQSSIRVAKESWGLLLSDCRPTDLI